MIAFLRFLGVTNAAIWFGSAFFFTFVGAPTFFSEEMRRMFPPPYNGLVAQLAFQRFFVLHYWCAVVAALHLAAEWAYAGREVRRATVWLLAGLFALALAGGLWMQPKLSALQKVKYAEQYRVQPAPAPEERQAAAAAFGRWHGFSQVMNLAMLAGLWMFLSQTVRQDDGAKVLGVPKFGIDNRS